jgi:hypothetical protein
MAAISPTKKELSESAKEIGELFQVDRDRAGSWRAVLDLLLSDKLKVPAFLRIKELVSALGELVESEPKVEHIIPLPHMQNSTPRDISSSTLTVRITVFD